MLHIVIVCAATFASEFGQFSCTQDPVHLQHQRPRQVQGHLLAGALSFLDLCFYSLLISLPVHTVSGFMCHHPEWILNICVVLVLNTGSVLLLGSVNVNHNASKLYWCSRAEVNGALLACQDASFLHCYNWSVATACRRPIDRISMHIRKHQLRYEA